MLQGGMSVLLFLLYIVNIARFNYKDCWTVGHRFITNIFIVFS